MNRPRRWSALACLVLLPLPVVRAADPAEEKWLFDRAVTISPKAEPVPALQYRLFPLVSERKDGNAVPMYLRFAHERGDVVKREFREKPEAWNKLPLKAIPLAEAHKFLAGWRYNLKQLDLGARRKTADWSYALDIGSVIEIRLPDMQEMRMQAPVLVLQARVAMAERRWADAVRTLETGFSFSQQVADQPFIIGDLVGIAIANQFLDCLLELLEQPDSPNLYWALTALPRPLIDLRRGMEFEYKYPEMQFPDLADLERPRTAAEWDAALARVRKEWERIVAMMNIEGDKKNEQRPNPSPDLAAARKYLSEVVGLPAASVAAMPPAQVLLLHLAHGFRQYRDEAFKAAYLSFPQGQAVWAEADRRLKEAGDADPARFARMWLPAIGKVFLAQNARSRPCGSSKPCGCTLRPTTASSPTRWPT